MQSYDSHPSSKFLLKFRWTSSSPPTNFFLSTNRIIPREIHPPLSLSLELLGYLDSSILAKGRESGQPVHPLIPCPVSRYIYPRFKKTSSLRRFRTTLFDPRPPPRIRSILFSDRDGERNPSGNSKDRDKWLKKAFRPARGIIGRGKGTSWIREFLFLTKVFGINSPLQFSLESFLESNLFQCNAGRTNF